MASSKTDKSGGPGKTKINLRLSEQLLSDVDDVWQDRGFNSRSEFLRQAIRDSVHTQELSAETLESLVISERQKARGETISSKEMRSRYLDEE